MKDSCSDWFAKFTSCFKDLFAGVTAKSTEPVQAGYQTNFEQAPVNMDSDDDDNDEEDVGRDVSNEIGKELSYDSDE
jgi:hypothetical protein